MKNKEKTKGKKIRINFFYLLVMVIFVLVSSSNIYKQYLDRVELENEIKNLKYEIDQEEKRNEELKSQTEFHESDEYIEKVAREQLGMIKSNEKVYIERTE